MTSWESLPRAVFPSTQLQEVVAPVLGTRAHAVNSPLPFGIAVYVVNSTATGDRERHLPLYWVSHAAATERKIEPGWYIAAENEKVFSLRLPDVQTGKLRIHGVPVAENRACAVELFVDGTNVEGFPKCIDRTCNRKDRIWLGFTVAKRYVGDAGGTKFLRVFTFKNNTTSETNISEANSVVGTIELKIYCGVYREYQQKIKSLDSNLEVEKLINEKEIVKEGKTIGVDRTGTILQERNNHKEGSFWMIERETEPDGGFLGQVNIFVRDRSRLGRLGIMKESGKASEPAVNESVTLGNPQRKRTPKNRAPIIDKVDLTDSPPNPKPDVVDLTDPPLNPDVVDLTGDSEASAMRAPVNGDSCYSLEKSNVNIALLLCTNLIVVRNPNVVVTPVAVHQNAVIVPTPSLVQAVAPVTDGHLSGVAALVVQITSEGSVEDAES